jgi:hypothetical protein
VAEAVGRDVETSEVRRIKRCAVRLVVSSFIALAALACVDTAAAQSHAQHARQMDAAMEEYFAGEESAGGAALALGLTTGGIGAGLLADDHDFGVGMAIPLIAAGSLQAIIGTVLLARSDGQLEDRLAQHARDPAAYRGDELPRMERVNFWFGVYKVVWIGLMGVGAAGVVFGIVDDRPGFVGAGLGLSAQAGATLAFDVIAEDRAEIYTEQIREHTPAVDVALGPAGAALRGSF